MSSESTREVYDGWATWRCRIIEARSAFRRRHGFKVVRERRFDQWEQSSVSFFYASHDAAVAAAHAFLDAKWLDGALVPSKKNETGQ